MRCKIRSLSTDLNLTTSICSFRRCSIARLSAGAGLSRAGRHGRHPRAQELIYRNTRPLVQTVQPPAPRIIQNTVHQTVVHLHQTTHQHIRSQITARAGGQGHTTLLVRQSAASPAEGSVIDPSRPAWTARWLLRILSMESARRTMRPFYQEMFQGFLEQAQEAHRGKPAQSLLLVQRLLGRHQTLTTLRRFYQRTVEQLDGAILRRLICRQFVRTIRQEQSGGFIYRYAKREMPVPEDLRRLAVAKRHSLPPPPPSEQEVDPVRQAEPQKPLPPSNPPCLSGSDFQALVRGVADALSRQSRLDSLRRGGI